MKCEVCQQQNRIAVDLSKKAEPLTRTIAPTANMKSFRNCDRMLPTQNHVPDGGIGNLIALPLQGRALREGNSAFIDEN